jgi:hypothetical protein
MWHKYLVPGILLLGVILSGCATMDSKLKAPPSPGAGYVDKAQMAKTPDLPFNKAWTKQGVDWTRYTTIYIAPVNTDYLLKSNWWQKGLRSSQMKDDVAYLATYMRTQFVKAFQDDPRHRFRVVLTPDKGSLTLEMALTELVPSHLLLAALKIGGPYGSGVAVAGLERGAEAQSTVAFESRIKDTDTGETLAMAADREYAKFRPIDISGLVWFGPAENIIKTWAQQFVQVANKQPGEIIKPASNFSLLPW